MISARIKLEQVNDAFAEMKTGGVARWSSSSTASAIKHIAVVLLFACAAAFAARGGDIYVGPTRAARRTSPTRCRPSTPQRGGADGRARDHALRSNSTWTKSPR